DEDPLPQDVVARVAGDVEARDPGDRPEPERDGRRRRAEQQPIEPTEQAELLDGGAAARPRGRSRTGSRVLDHQSECTAPITGAPTLKKCSKTLRAAGAAAVPPWPP